MYGIYANIWGILMVNVTIHSIHGSYGYPPTLAFAKAGAAPGTTGGVDPVFLEPLPRRGSCLSCTFATPTLQANAITRPQQWLKASPRPQQWLLIGVHGCRLTGFKPLKRLKCLAGRLPA